MQKLPSLLLPQGQKYVLAHMRKKMSSLPYYAYFSKWIDLDFRAHT